jgi:hypothetical protein
MKKREEKFKNTIDPKKEKEQKKKVKMKN